MIGQICFKTPVNLLGVNLDSVIDIQRGMCTVNLGSPESFQLNVPAVISLYGLRSEDKAYKEKIIQQTKNIGGKLICYDGTKGEWIFEVDNFII